MPFGPRNEVVWYVSSSDDVLCESGGVKSAGVFVAVDAAGEYSVFAALAEGTHSIDNPPVIPAALATSFRAKQC